MVTRACLRYAREGQNVTQAGPKCPTSRAKMSHKGQNVTQSCYNEYYNTPMMHFGPYVTFQPCVHHFSAHSTSLFSPVAVPFFGSLPPPSDKNNKFNIKSAKQLKKKKRLSWQCASMKTICKLIWEEIRLCWWIWPEQMPRNKSCACMVTEHMLVKMATSSQHLQRTKLWNSMGECAW